MNTTTHHAAVQAARQELAVTARTATPEQLAKLVNTVAYTEGYHTTRDTLRTVVERRGVQAARGVALRLANADPDDTWSGRANDVRRAKADGVRQAIADALYEELYEEGQ